jgi:DnaJ-class molecular chaperone
MSDLYVMNQSALVVEQGEITPCPRCKGSGRVWGDDEPCALCLGEQIVVRSSSGWTRTMRENDDQSRLW